MSVQAAPGGRAPAGRPVLDWPGEPVALGDVERVLRRQAAEQRRGGDQGVVHTRVATLLIVAGDLERAHDAVRVVEAITGRNPSRCIALLARPPDGRPEVRAWARVVPRAGLQPGTRRVREEVLVDAAVPPRHLAEVVLPLLLPDIPVFAWWLGAVPFGRPVAGELLGVADRLVVDSAAFGDPGGDLRRLAGAAVQGPPATDLMWGRLTPWRELLAVGVDGLPARAAVERATAVRIAAVRPTAGLLFAGWLASRLGWQAEEVTPGERPCTGTARYRSPAGAVEVELRAAAGPHALASVRLAAAGGAEPVRVSLEAKGSLLLASYPGGQEIAQTRIGSGAVSDTQALQAELEVFGRDRVFEEALDATAPWTGAAG
ncbi:MAG TPA: glucose-6-phosphate dehydrogenase assembly protein OpcA [Actinomycetes bacterium]|nr:glucose-6-phosphate dehydrogenase assembly protein OpcA [Actinomycetes bacterium]